MVKNRYLGDIKNRFLMVSRARKKKSVGTHFLIFDSGFFYFLPMSILVRIFEILTKMEWSKIEKIQSQKSKKCLKNIFSTDSEYYQESIFGVPQIVIFWPFWFLTSGFFHFSATPFGRDFGNPYQNGHVQKVKKSKVKNQKMCTDRFFLRARDTIRNRFLMSPR